MHARAGVHRADEHEVRRVGHRRLRAGDRHHTILDRLSEHLEHLLAELRKLVQEQHAAMRQADLARTRPAAPAD